MALYSSTTFSNRPNLRSGILQGAKKKSPYEQNYSSYGTISSTPKQTQPKAPIQSPAYNQVTGQPNFKYQQPQQEQPSNDIYSNFADRYNTTSQAQINSLKERQVQADTYYNKLYDSKAERLRQQIPELQKQSDSAVNVYKELQATGTTRLQDQAGERLRAEAQAQRESRAGLENKFAQLGTVDSGGHYGYTGQAQQSEDEFLRRQSSIRQERDLSVKDLDTQTRGLIEQTVSDFNAQVKNIQNTIYDNEDLRMKDLQTAYNSLEDAMFGIENTYNQQLTELDKFILEQNAAGGGTKVADDLRNEYIMRTEKSNFPLIYQQYQKIANTPDSAAGDLSLIFSYMRMLDPSSTVREGEFATAQNTTGVPSRVLNTYNNVLNGQRLNPTQRSDFQSQAKSIFEQAREQQDMVDQYYNTQSQGRNINPYDVTGLYSGFTGGQSSQDNDPLGLFK